MSLDMHTCGRNCCASSETGVKTLEECREYHPVSQLTLTCLIQGTEPKQHSKNTETEPQKYRSLPRFEWPLDSIHIRQTISTAKPLKPNQALGSQPTEGKLRFTV